MKRITKIVTLITLLSILAIPMVASAVSLDREVSVFVDGKPVQFNSDLGYPKGTTNGRTLVPVRIISEDMGYKVDWQKEEQKITISDDKTKIEFKVGETTALVNGNKIPMDTREDANGNKIAVNTKAQVINSRTYVPLRFVSETMGATVDYKISGQTMYIYITKPGSTPVIPEIPVPPVTTGKITGTADYTVNGHAENIKKVSAFFGSALDSEMSGKTQSFFNPIGGGTDGSFLYVIDRAGEDFEALVVIKTWFSNEAIGTPYEKEMRNILPTTKEVLRFYLPKGYDKLYKIIDDGFNYRWDDASKYVNKDISKMIGSDKKVVLIDGNGGLQIEIGVGK